MNHDELTYRANKCYAADVVREKVSEYIDFAFYLLENKIESENIFILAGLSESEKDDARHYFERVLDELKIKIEKSKTDYFYICYLFDGVKAGKLSAFDAVYDLEKLYCQTQKKIFQEWLDLSYEIDFLYDDTVLIDQRYTLTRENAEAYILRAFELFKIFYDLDLPEDFYEQAYCQKCGRRVIPKNVVKGLFKKKYLTICPKCKGDSFTWCFDNAGKELYLREIGFSERDSEPANNIEDFD